MALISEEDARQLLESSGPRGKVAILIFDGVQIIDYTGPYEIFGAADFDVYTVARTKNPVTTTMGMTVVPKFSFGDAPPPDVLVIPGGGVRGVETDSVTLDWIRNTSGHTSTTMSVCNGAFILARAGLLDGLSATTTNGNLAALREQFPRVTVVDDKRYVDNGKIITTAGLSAGIDGALHVVSRIQGIGAAEQTALAEEYPWHEGREYVRAALAENLIPIGNIPGEYGRWNVETTNGDTKRWELVLTGRSQKTAPELDKFFESRCTGKGWKRVSAAPGSGGTEWSFTGPGDAVWHGILSIQPARSKTNEYLVRISIARAGLD
jgi:putative intracellular protease/amidase